MSFKLAFLYFLNVLVVFLVFFSGLSFGYYLAQTNIKQTCYMLVEKEDFIFKCNQYSEPFYSCEQNLKFMNITGLYCNSTIVCENKLRGR